MAALFRRLLGTAFDALPAPIRDIHDAASPAAFVGTCRVERGTSLPSRLVGFAVRLPAATHEVALRVTIVRDARGERWVRDFARHRMTSLLRDSGGRLHERLGLARFTFGLEARDDGIAWRLEGVRALGVPLPLAWFAGVHARECVADGRYGFDVRAEVALVGLLVHYTGTLQPETRS